ncbi:MAG: tol-pal system protein YbgF [Deltaproteobacteria bacterium]|nr:tol-pal system protein YbgF [Deltaproteobacteria bacterium]
MTPEPDGRAGARTAGELHKHPPSVVRSSGRAARWATGLSALWRSRSLRLLAVLPLLAAFWSAQGCAPVTQNDFAALQSRVIYNQNKVRDLDKKINDLTGQMSSSQAPQAEMLTDMDSLRQEVMRLNGKVEELTHQVNQLTQGGGAAGGQVEDRLTRLEAYLGLAKETAAAAPVAGGARTVAGSSSTPPPAGGSQAPAAPPAPVKETPQAAYNLALKLHKEKSYQASRDRFEDFMRKYPDSNLVGHAQFWIGENYFDEKRYEEAILAYNQVIKRYSNSPKAPAALLKQGMAFQALGDKRTAAIVFNKLIKSYSKTSEAKTAQTLLKKLN